MRNEAKCRPFASGGHYKLVQVQLGMPLGLLSITRAVTRRAQRGLYAGKKVIFGNNISEDGGNKTRRNWKPNAQPMTLYSEILDRRIRMRVTAAALRNIDKAGGLDNYILHTKPKYLDSEFGMSLREDMLKQLAKLEKQQRAGTTA